MKRKKRRRRSGWIFLREVRVCLFDITSYKGFLRGREGDEREGKGREGKHMRGGWDGMGRCLYVCMYVC